MREGRTLDQERRSAKGGGKGPDSGHGGVWSTGISHGPPRTTGHHVARCSSYFILLRTGVCSHLVFRGQGVRDGLEVGHTLEQPTDLSLRDHLPRHMKANTKARALVRLGR